MSRRPARDRCWWTCSTSRFGFLMGLPAAVWRTSSTSLSLVPNDLMSTPSVFSSPWKGRVGREEVAVGVVRAAGAEDDVRPDQPGEEHDLGGEEQPHGDLAGGDGRRCGSGAWAFPAGFECVVLWVAIAIVRSTLRTCHIDKRSRCHAPACSGPSPVNDDRGLSSSRSRIAGK